MRSSARPTRFRFWPSSPKVAGMPDVSFTNLLIICAVAVAAPMLVGLLPWLRIPAVVL